MRVWEKETLNHLLSKLRLQAADLATAGCPPRWSRGHRNFQHLVWRRQSRQALRSPRGVRLCLPESSQPSQAAHPIGTAPAKEVVYSVACLSQPTTSATHRNKADRFLIAGVIFLSKWFRSTTLLETTESLFSLEWLST